MFNVARLAIVVACLVGCGGSTASSVSSGSSGAAGGASADASRALISFRNDLLYPFPGFELSCGLSSSCHHDPVHDPKTDRVFLGCSEGTNSSCVVTDPADQVYRGLVGNPAAGQLVMSMEMPAMPLVTPGDPDKSYLVLKLEGNHPAVPASFVATVRAWVQEGAPDN